MSSARSLRFASLALALALFAGLLLTVAPPPAKGGPAPAEAAPWWVEWLEAFDRNGNKIDDEADALAIDALEAGRPEKTVPVLVTFAKYPSDPHAVVKLLGAEDDAFLFETQPVMDLNVPAEKFAVLAALPGLAAVEHDRILSPYLNVSAPATQANRGTGSNTFYNGKTAEDLGYTGKDMVVAVLDTGVQDQHSAFTGRRIAGATVSATSGSVTDCTNPADDDGHGTHVASTAMGSMSADNLYGTAKEAKLVEVKISAGPVESGGSNRGFEFVKRYNDAYDAGTPLCGPDDDRIDVVNLSFGSLGRGGPNAGTSEQFIDALVNSGVAVVIAAGNCGPTPSSTCTFGDDDNGISSPGNAAGAITVANSNDGGTVNRNNDVIAPSSSRGPNNGSGDTAAGGATSAANLKDRYRKPEVAAPGTNIQAAGPAPFLLSTKSGTSMASPHVAGIAALLLQAGAQAAPQTGGVNLMASTGNGYVGNDYVRGIYPVRDAIIHSTDYKEAGAKATWTGPNSKGVQWNNAWGYGHVNAFDALCWAWNNVLKPGGATPPPAVAANCTIVEPSPSPSPSASASPSPSPSPSASPSPSPSASPSPSPSPSVPVGGGATYYFHSLTGDNMIDQAFTNAATFDKTFPTWGPDSYSTAQDIPGLQNAGLIEQVDPTWKGTLDARATSLSVDFWAEEIPDQDLGSINYTVRVKPQGSTSYIELLPAISADVTEVGPINIKHTFTQMGTAAAPLPLDLPAGPLTFTIRGTYTIDDAYTRIYFDSTNYPSGFSVNGGGQPTPSPTSSATASPSPSPSPSVSPSPTPSPTPTTPTSGRRTYPVSTNDSFAAAQWNMARIEAPQAWQEPRATGHGIKIAITDSGLDLGHPDFACSDKLEVLPGSDVTDGDNDPSPKISGDEHGTHVAGIAGACTHNGIGVAGVAPDATIMPIRTIGGGNIVTSLTTKLDTDMAAAVRLATDNGAHVINMSIGPIPPLSHVGGALYPKTESALDYARQNGVVIAAAAGNFSQPSCEYPSRSRNVICVVATDMNDERSDYSDFAINVDPNGDPALYPVVAAPGGGGYSSIFIGPRCGGDILSTVWRSADHFSCSPGNGYDEMSGTSMSSPHVAGIAALLYDRLGGERTKENADLIVQTILDTADDLYTPGFDPLVGHGRVNARRAVLAIDPVEDPTLIRFTEESDVSTQFTDEATFEVKLTDADGGALTNETVAFALEDATGETAGEWTATTNGSGIARLTQTMDFPAGDYEITVAYAGRYGYLAPAAATTEFEVLKEDSELRLVVDHRSQPRILYATLTDPDGSRGGFAGRTLEFYAGEELLGTSETDGNGAASLQAPAPFDRGRHQYRVVFVGGDSLLASDATFETPKLGTALSVTEGSSTSGQFTDAATVEVSLSDEDGSPLGGEDLSFAFDGDEGTATTDGSGVASRTLQLDVAPGHHVVTVSYGGDAEHASSTLEMPFTVEKEDVGLALEVEGSSPRSLVASLTDADDPASGFAGREITFYSGDEAIGTAVTGGDGTARFEPSDPYGSGARTYVAEFLGDDHLNGGVSAPAEAGDVASVLRFTERSATKGQYTDEAVLEARLTSTEGTPISGAEVTLELNGPGGSGSWSATTDVDGLGEVTAGLDLEPGTYDLVARFTGGNGYAASNEVGTFTIEKEDSRLTLTSYGKGEDRWVLVRLSDDDNIYRSISGRQVAIFAEGNHIGDVVTGTYGEAYFQPPKKYQNGRRTFEAFFVGDAYWHPSSALHRS